MEPNSLRELASLALPHPSPPPATPPTPVLSHPLQPLPSPPPPPALDLPKDEEERPESMSRQGSEKRESISSYLSDNDDPLPSGFGDVSKDCTELELRGWIQVLSKWKTNSDLRPKGLTELVRKGIPEALRGEVWQLLANCYEDQELIAEYALLLEKECRDEVYVQRDISRTFPAHEYFRESGSLGQESLYRLCKAYSVYDDEIGYCQGLSFMAAALLLHMPEEQAFCVLVKIMHDYGLRTLFRCGFEELHLRFYQLERLMEDQMPDLFSHFEVIGIEAHMYASQWFLTLFTAKFPLYLVFYIVDLFLLEGMCTMFQVALALLQLSKKDLLLLDFEGVLKYFRVQLPKKYRCDENARLLLRTAVAKKVKNIVVYAQEHQLLKDQDKQKGDALKRFQRENKRLVYGNMRLEQENDDLARELVSSKINLRKQLDISEDKADTLNKELLAANIMIVELEDERTRLGDEVTQLKEMCRRELDRAEKEIKRNAAIINEYKQICSQLSFRLETEEASSKEAMSKVLGKIKDCESCYKKINETKSLVNGVNGDNARDDETTSPGDENEQPEDGLETRVRELELELAQTKLALVEAECINQDLVHALNATQTELQASKSTWYNKTLASIREVTKKDGSKEGHTFSRENSREFASN